MDVLLIDDIQFIAGKERTQAEFFHTFNALYDNTKQIVVTSDKFPGILLILKSGCALVLSGLDCRHPTARPGNKGGHPEQEGRIRELSVPQEVAFYLASNVEHNVRVLEGSLVRVSAYASLHNVPITIELAKEVMGHIIKEKKREVTVDAIIKEVAAHFSIKTTELKSNRRIRSIVVPRQIATYLARKLTDESLVGIVRSSAEKITPQSFIP